LNDIKDERIVLPIKADNIFYFKQYNETEAFIECCHWDEAEGYWTTGNSFGGDFEEKFEELELIYCNCAHDAIDKIIANIFDSDDLDNLDYIDNEYNLDAATKQFREFLEKNFTEYWEKEHKQRE